MKPRSHLVLKSKANPRTSRLTSQLLAEQITAFLKAGGKITKIRPGVTGEKASLDEDEA